MIFQRNLNFNLKKKKILPRVPVLSIHTHIHTYIGINVYLFQTEDTLVDFFLKMLILLNLHINLKKSSYENIL